MTDWGYPTITTFTCRSRRGRRRCYLNNPFAQAAHHGRQAGHPCRKAGPQHADPLSLRERFRVRAGSALGKGFNANALTAGLRFQI